MLFSHTLLVGIFFITYLICLASNVYSEREHFNVFTLFVFIPLKEDKVEIISLFFFKTSPTNEMICNIDRKSWHQHKNDNKRHTRPIGIADFYF